MTFEHKGDRLRILSYIIAAYMLLIFAWWTILLLKKNKEVFETRTALVQFDRGNIAPAERILDIRKEFEKQRLMIMGEGLVFVLALLIGIWLINRGYRREIDGIRQKRNFLLAITHELKSPLASIRITLETFMKRNLEEVDRNRLSKNALTETDRLTGLIDNLLLAAKLDKSYQPIFEKVDLVKIIRLVKKDLLNLFPDTQLQILTTADPMDAALDQQGIYSTLYNICENAIKYSPKPAKINAHLGQDQDGINIEISDLGIGIPDGDKLKIFDQFYRLGDEENRKTTGTGLGLYIAKRMVALHHGSIAVRDNIPTGSVFIIKLPIRKNT